MLRSRVLSMISMPGVCAGLLAFAALASAGGVEIEGPRFVVKATDVFEWVIPVRVRNTLDAGVYADSIACQIEDLDPGVSGAGRMLSGRTYDLGKMRALSRDDSLIVQYTAPALVENARLTFKLYAHTADGETHVSETECETGPSITGRRFRSRFIDQGKLHVEVVYVPEPWPRGTSPGLLLVHPEGSHARRLIPLAWNMANHGVSVMLVSMPGYGLSSGEADFAGPATVRALELALDSLRSTPPIDPNRIAVYGISRGATAAALLAAKRTDLAALILQSGVFDPKTAYQNTKSDSLRWALDHEARREGGWSRRSAVKVAAKIRVPTLFLHGELDLEAPSSETMGLAGKLRAQGGDVQLELMPGGGHTLPAEFTLPKIESFLKERFSQPTSR